MRRRGRPPHPDVLTPREREVVDLVVRGLTNREAAERLDVTEATVRYHLNQVYSKLHIDHRDELRRWWERGGHREASGRSPFRAMLKPVLLAGAGGLAVVAVIAGAAFFAPRAARESEPEPTRATAAVTGNCLGESVLVPTPAAVTCLDTTADLQAAVAFSLLDVSGSPALQPERAALLEMPGGIAAYRSFVHDGRQRIEIVETAAPSGILGAEVPMRDPLAISIPGATDSPRAAFVSSPAGPILWWCPDWVHAAGTVPDDCGSGRTIGIAGATREDLSLLVYEVASGGTYQTAPGTVVATGPTPVPFPPLKGERVEPVVRGLPVMPGANEVDGFTKPSPMPGHSDSAVQVFETTASVDSVLAWYEAELTAAGWTRYHGFTGVTGQANGFSHGDRSEWVEISGAYVARPEDESQSPPPGFRGKGVPFASPVDSGSRFWVVTWTE